jgi:hypothetical protein
MLTAALSLGLLELSDDRYALAPVSEDYLLDSSPTSFGPILDLCVASGTLSYAAIERALATGSRQTPAGDFASFEEQADLARAFTRGMHSVSFSPALAWPELVDLSGDELVLDVAGGSGAHSIGACLHWPDVRAIVLDQSPVCDVAEELVASYGLEGRITTLRADMWEDTFPAADIHFYSNILHDWLPEKGQFLVEKSFATLEPGGRILLHEALLHDDKSGPYPVAGFSVAMVAWAEGQQYSGRELSDMLTAAGFQDIRITCAFAPYSIVEGRKP